MPLTFLAHQALFMPLLRRFRHRIDGLAFVIGTMAPDLPHAFAGSRWSVWAHSGWAVVWCNVPVGLVVTWLTARVLAPVVADHLPDGGPLHLRDYRGLAAHRLSLWSPMWVLIGALTHVGMDHFSHDWGWFAERWQWYRTVIVHDPILDIGWTPYKAMQFAGHGFGLLLGLYFLVRYGRQRWFDKQARSVPSYPVTARSSFVLWGCTGLCASAAILWVLSDRRGSAVDIMRAAGGCYAGLLLGSLVIRVLLQNDKGKKSMTAVIYSS